MNKYKNLTDNQKFLEFRLEILHACLMAATLQDAQESFGKLSELVLKDSVATDVKDQFNKAVETFNRLLKQFQNTTEDSIYNSEYREILTKLRDELEVANELYEK